MARLATVALLLAVCATAAAVTPALRGQVKAECPADMLHELVTKCPNLMENPMMKTMMTKMKPEQLVTMINNYLSNRKTRLTVLSYLETYCAAEIPGFCTMCHLNDCPHSLQEQEDSVHKFQLESGAKPGKDTVGLVAGHAYTMLAAKQVRAQRINWPSRVSKETHTH